MGAATAPQWQGDDNVPRRQGSSGPLLNCTWPGGALAAARPLASRCGIGLEPWATANVLYIVLRLYRTFPAAAGMRCVHHAHICIAQPSAMPLRSITGAASRALVYARRANAMQCSPRPPSQNSSRFCQTDQAFSRRDMKAPQRDHGRFLSGVRGRCTVCGLPVRVLAGEHT